MTSHITRHVIISHAFTLLIHLKKGLKLALFLLLLLNLPLIKIVMVY